MAVSATTVARSRGNGEYSASIGRCIPVAPTARSATTIRISSSDSATAAPVVKVPPAEAIRAIRRLTAHIRRLPPAKTLPNETTGRPSGNWACTEAGALVAMTVPSTASARNPAALTVARTRSISTRRRASASSIRLCWSGRRGDTGPAYPEPDT
jgi:hypothetical protein